MRDIMLDIETLGTTNRGAIVSIGAVSFDLLQGRIGSTFYRVVDLKSSVAAGGEITASTVCWWMQQSDAAREIFNDTSAVPLRTALVDFSAFFMSEYPLCEARVWGNGPSFDCVLLRNAYDACGMGPAPWSYRNERCYRTMRDVLSTALVTGGVQPPDISRAGTVHHNALDDAIAQAEHLLRMASIIAKGVPA